MCKPFVVRLRKNNESKRVLTIKSFRKYFYRFNNENECSFRILSTNKIGSFCPRSFVCCSEQKLKSQNHHSNDSQLFSNGFIRNVTMRSNFCLASIEFKKRKTLQSSKHSPFLFLLEVPKIWLFWHAQLSERQSYKLILIPQPTVCNLSFIWNPSRFSHRIGFSPFMSSGKTTEKESESTFFVRKKNAEKTFTIHVSDFFISQSSRQQNCFLSFEHIKMYWLLCI